MVEGVLSDNLVHCQVAYDAAAQDLIDDGQRSIGRLFPQMPAVFLARLRRPEDALGIQSPPLVSRLPAHLAFFDPLTIPLRV
jgi:hypothetical protein